MKMTQINILTKAEDLVYLGLFHFDSQGLYSDVCLSLLSIRIGLTRL